MSFFPRELAAPDVETPPAIEWEEPDCLLCGSRESSALVESPDTTAGGTGLWHSLERVHFPLAVLREVRRLLVPGGQLFRAVPNIDSLPFRWFGSAWYGLDLPRHLTHFAPWTLHLMLERAGFRVGQIQMVRHSQWLRSSARLACDTGMAAFWHRL